MAIAPTMATRFSERKAASPGDTVPGAEPARPSKAPRVASIHVRIRPKTSPNSPASAAYVTDRVR